MCPTLAAHSSSFVPSKVDYWYSHLPVQSAGKPAGWREVGVTSHHKTTSSSTTVFLLCFVYCVLLGTLLTFKCFNNEFSDFSFTCYSTLWCTHIMKYFILEIILNIGIKFLSIVILYPHVVLYQQISTLTIAEIFLKISNLQHVSPKL